MAGGVAPAQEDLRSILMTKDDLLHCFYIFLWSKGPDGLGVKGVRIPDTVILNHSRVLEYYFTSADGSVKRKSRANLVTSHLLEQLEKHNSRKCKTGGIAASILNKDPSLPTGLSVIPYSIETLRPALVEGSVGSGTMQFFIEPKKEGAAAHNACVGVHWTPNVTYMEKRTNVNPISAPAAAVSLIAKATLEDGSPNVRTSQTISSRVSAEIDRMCRSIAEHFLVVFKARILHMGLEFKVDAKEQTWLTHCFSLKLADASAPTKALYSLQLKAEDDDARSRAGDDELGGGPRANPFLSRAERIAAATAARRGPGGGAQDVLPEKEILLSEKEGNGLSSRAVKNASPTPSGSSALSHRSGPAGGRSASGLGHYGRSKAGKSGTARTLGSTQVALVRCSVCGIQEMVQPSFVARHNLLFPLSLLSFFCSNSPGTVFIDDSRIEYPEEIPDYIAMMHEHEHTPCGPTERGGNRSDSALGDYPYEKKLSNGSPKRNEEKGEDELGEGYEGGGSRLGNSSVSHRRAVPKPLTLEMYDTLRRDPAWLNTQLHCCESCTDELRSVVEDLVIDADGKIRVPTNSASPIGAVNASTSAVRAARSGTYAQPTVSQLSRLDANQKRATAEKVVRESPYTVDLAAEMRRNLAASGGSGGEGALRRKKNGGEATVGLADKGGGANGTRRPEPVSTANSRNGDETLRSSSNIGGEATSVSLPPLAPPSRKSSFV